MDRNSIDVSGPDWQSPVVPSMSAAAPAARSGNAAPAAILLAAGSGSLGAETPKQFLPLLGRPVIRLAAEALAPHISLLQPVGPAGPIAASLHGLPHLPPVPGGPTRRESVRAGLEALAPHAPELVLVHDAARPIVPPDTVPRLLAALVETSGAIPAVAVADTLQRSGGTGRVAVSVPRDGLFHAQTPQAFRFADLLRLHRAAVEPGATLGATDDAALLEAASLAVALVPGSEDNIKITLPEDLARAARILAPTLLPRTGLGFDVHAFARGRPLVLCGIEIPHDQGLAGHSDADVGIHALCDAIYGALAEGDIGRHFPPSEAAWKDADSARFLAHAAGLVSARGGVLANADLTLICERPKIAPHAAAMRTRLAALLGVAESAVSVKATTTERLGFTGRGEGIAAQAIATVLLPASR